MVAAHLESAIPQAAPALTNTQIAMLNRAWRTDIRIQRGMSSNAYLPAFAFYDDDDAEARAEMKMLVDDGYMDQNIDDARLVYAITAYGIDFIIDYDASTLTTPEYELHSRGRASAFADTMKAVRAIFALPHPTLSLVNSDTLESITDELRRINAQLTGAQSERDRLRTLVTRLQVTAREGARLLRMLSDNDAAPSHSWRRANERMVADYLDTAIAADAHADDGIPF